MVRSEQIGWLVPFPPPGLRVLLGWEYVDLLSSNFLSIDLEIEMDMDIGMDILYTVPKPRQTDIRQDKTSIPNYTINSISALDAPDYSTVHIALYPVRPHPSQSQ